MSASDINRLAVDLHNLSTFVIGSIAFLIALWVIYRARHDDAPHPTPTTAEPEAIVRTRRVIVGTVIAAGLSWPVSLWAAPLNYCNGPLWYLMAECWWR